jgi:hypothetical protein
MAFGDELPTGRYAAFALHLEIKPDEVDVNVHPSKTEVRFRRLREVHDLLYAATRQALSQFAETLPAAAVVYASAPVSVDMTRVAESVVAPRARSAAAESPATANQGTGDPLIGGQFLPVIGAGGGVDIFDLVSLIRDLLGPSCAPLSTRTLTFPCRMPAPPGPGFGLTLAAYADFGFEFAAISPTAWALRTVPAVLPELMGEVLVQHLLNAPGFAATPLIAAAQASARALCIPPEMALRAIWIAAWRDRAERAGLVFAHYQCTLDAAALAKMFTRPPPNNPP